VGCFARPDVAERVIELATSRSSGGTKARRWRTRLSRTSRRLLSPGRRLLRQATRSRRSNRTRRSSRTTTSDRVAPGRFLHRPDGPRADGARCAPRRRRHRSSRRTSSDLAAATCLLTRARWGPSSKRPTGAVSLQSNITVGGQVRSRRSAHGHHRNPRRRHCPCSVKAAATPVRSPQASSRSGQP
jgi:hypothetical protein